MDSVETAKFISGLPLAVLLALVLIGGYLGWWIYGSIHKAEMIDMVKQLDAETARAKEWKDLYLAERNKEHVE